MKKQITKEMVIHLNQELYEKGYCFSYKLEYLKEKPIL